jgi:uncharacterized protein (DUF302 family)
MGFGFVVARFGLFLQQLQTLRNATPEQSFGLSLWFGTLLIASGVLVNVFAGWHHFRLVKELDRGERNTATPQTRLLRLHFFWRLLGWRWRSSWYQFETQAICMDEAEKETKMTLDAGRGIVAIPSNYTVDETVERLKGILEAKQVTLFALVDHSGEAAKAGKKMPATKLLIFGSPAAGTPVMLAAPSIAIDLPLKILIWEDGQGRTWISYNSPAYLQARHGVPPELLKNIAVVETLAAKAGE